MLRVLLRSTSSVLARGRHLLLPKGVISEHRLPNLLFQRQQRHFADNGTPDFESASEETLESLGERFERLLEADPRMVDSDVSLSNGVLTVVIPERGTYVINKQSPNRQVWLSSPLSGPARFDLVGGTWVYKRSNETLHALLNREVGEQILNVEAKFEECHLGGGGGPDE